jgi:hypothetical protein
MADPDTGKRLEYPMNGAFALGLSYVVVSCEDIEEKQQLMPLV